MGGIKKGTTAFDPLSKSNDKLIKSASKKKIASGSVLPADIDINYKFYNQFRINMFQLPSEQDNEIVFHLFHAENIQFSNSFSLKATDDIIHGQFMDHQL